MPRPVGSRRPFGDLAVTRRLSVLNGVIALAWLVAALVGAITGRLPLAVFGLMMFLGFGVASWWLSPWRIRRNQR